MRRIDFLKCVPGAILSAPVIAGIAVESNRPPSIRLKANVQKFAHDERVWAIHDPDSRITVIRHRRPWETEWAEFPVPVTTDGHFLLGLHADAQVRLDYHP